MSPWQTRLTMWSGAALVMLLAVLTFAPVISSDGWPMNHEFSLPWHFNSFYLRTLLYAEHMAQGDWFPIWSVADNDGFGSPQPLMYHKLFYLVSGGLLVLTGQMKESILLSLWFFLLVGAGGVYWLCRQVGCNRFLAWCGAMLLLLANYTITNWLVRGAMAEFAAAMLAPWVLSAFLLWLRTPDARPYARFSFLGLCVGLVFLGHSVLAFYLVLLLAACFAGLVLLRQVSWRVLRIGPLIWGALVFAVITGPYLAAMRIIGADYDMKRIIPVPFLPENQIKPFLSFIWDKQWQWGKIWDRYTVQLDWPILGLLLSGLLVLGSLYVFYKLKRVDVPQSRVLGLSLVTLGLLALLCLFLQTDWAIPFYQHFPGAAFIQFPWRLLGVLTPCLIALSLGLWQRLGPIPSTFGASICLLVSLGLCGAWVPIRYGATPDYVAHLDQFRFGAFGEYIPARAGTEVPYNVPSLRAMLAERQCTLRPMPVSSPEALNVAYAIDCKQPGTYPLPLFASPLHRVLVTHNKENGTTTAGCAADAAMPALCAVNLAQPGESLIQIRMPTLGSWINQIF